MIYMCRTLTYVMIEFVGYILHFSQVSDTEGMSQSVTANKRKYVTEVCFCSCV
jgi:hypothetical protein